MQFRNSFELILYKTYADIKAESARSYLGLLWWIIEPVLYLCAFYILFVLVLQRGGSDFVPTFLCGAVVWKWFDSGIKGGGIAIKAHSGLLQQVYVPKYIFPIIAVLSATYRFIPVFSVFLMFLLMYGIHMHFTWLAIPVVMVAQLLLVMSLAMFVGAITPFLPDLKVAIDNGMMLLFFISGVFFNINEVHEPLRTYLLINPMTGIINAYRDALIRNLWPNFSYLITVIIFSLLLCAVSLVFLKHLDRKYGKVRF